MNVTAKKLIAYGIIGVILGTLIAAYGPETVGWIDNRAGSNAETGLTILALVTNLLRGILIPVGAAFIGAGIVINVLSPANEKEPIQN